MTKHYDPRHNFEVKVRDIAYRRDESEVWLARIYQPQGEGPFPCLLDVHGGAWSLMDRTQYASPDKVLAASGLCVVAVDYRLAPKYPYPAQVADINFAIRWLKAHAPEFNADPDFMGASGGSSGGNTLMLSVMKPDDPLYKALPLNEAPSVDATVAWVIALWPVLDPYARYLYAQKAGREDLIKMTMGYFTTEKLLKEGNPQLILDRGEKILLPPVLIIQGTADDNIPLSIPQLFAKSYRAAGGELNLELFEGMPHGFAINPGPETQRSLEIMKTWIARQLAVRETKT